ncbi:hypothetical protein Sste5346_004227 [Sporothrix stenoceras]|uniref:Major facilitator superfamily (MFS) profile domain-containing protein n=1 Tax=Sporothrix stenoceras TaxID=5173 RepID=A0ABR3Z8M5_9PEZI
MANTPFPTSNRVVAWKSATITTSAGTDNSAKGTSNDNVVNAPSSSIDNALALDTVNAAESHCYTDTDYGRVLWKIGLILLPVMWFCYGTQQADNISVSTKATFSLKTDTHLVGQQYNWLTTIFYLAYLVAELRGNYLMQRTSLRWTLAGCMLIWGIFVLCIGFSNNFATIMTLRALRGAAESTIAPAFLLITAAFYARREHALCTIIWGSELGNTL